MRGTIRLKTGDITKEPACAIVNAANSSLMGGGGVDGAIHRAGGPKILEETKKIRETRYPDGLPTGEAIATTAGNLPAKYVIHTVGPIYRLCDGSCPDLLAAAYRNSLRVAYDLGCRDIVFPAISTGIYGYPKEEAARIAKSTVEAFIQKHPMDVTFIFHNPQDMALFQKATEENH